MIVDKWCFLKETYSHPTVFANRPICSFPTNPKFLLMDRVPFKILSVVTCDNNSFDARIKILQAGRWHCGWIHVTNPSLYCQSDSCYSDLQERLNF